MRHQGGRRDSKTFVVVDEDCGIPTAVVEGFRPFQEGGPLAQTDPRSVLLSMSEYDNNKQNYNVFDYNAATQPEQSQDYSGYEGAHQTFAGQYVSAHAQVPTGLPQQSTGLPLVPAAQESYPHDPTYYGQPYAQHPATAYLQPGPRQRPEIISWTPNQGQQGTKVIVHFRSIYDFDVPPVAVFLVFGRYRCQSILQKTAQQGTMYQYVLTADAPNFTATNSPSPVPLQLLFDDNSIVWESPTLDLGTFTYLDASLYYPPDSPQAVAGAARKRKLSPQSSPRRSPTKKPSTHRLFATSEAQARAYLSATGPIATPVSPFRRPSLPETYSQARRFSGPEYTQAAYGTPLTATASQQFYAHPSQTTPALQTAQSPSWGYQQSVASATRSPSVAAVSAGSRTAQLLPSPAASNPPLIRTSILQTPVTPGPSSAATNFNPYAMYPSNSKAILQIEGELNTMADRWTPVEMEAKRRLVQFRRTQSGSVISATFEPVTLEDRIPNSICVSCIWWEEKQACYVTSVDTISLLESLVAVRFTVEEKNRIRRNLEGFRPATVSKAKQDSEDFFKLIMGFPNPKPRNIEKDVKVFPWRILAGALKKIIGKYSASYSSTAGALPAASSQRASDTGAEHRPLASPQSTSSSAPSHHRAYAPAITTNAYSPHIAASAGLGIGPSAGQPDLRLAPPVSAASQTTSWQQPALYSSDFSASGRNLWPYDNYLTSSSPATGLPGSAQAYTYQPQRFPSLTPAPTMPVEARFVPLQDYEEQHQPTSTS